MNYAWRVCVLGVVLLLTLLLSVGIAAQARPTFSCSTVAEIPQAECEAMVALYDATDGDNWTDNTGWLTTNTPCSWVGVTCISGKVNSLLLNGNQLTGSIPSEIGNLTTLIELRLDWNQLSGPVPAEIGNLTALKSLHLEFNQLSGSIPAEISNLISLTELYLQGNQLSGVIPPEIGELTALKTLRMDANQLSGSIPPEVGNLTALVWLYLNDNQLSGSIPPEIGGLTALERLLLYSTQLSGPIPPEIGNLTVLTDLALWDNQLSGPIPPEIGNLPTLGNLDLHDNQLSGPIPAEIGNLTLLTRLLLHNNQLSGPIPLELGNLTALTWFSLSGNSFSGEVPVALTSLIHLDHFTFYDTEVCVPPTGAVPTWLNGIRFVYSTGLICGEELGSLSGTVTLTDTTPAVGVQVNLYRSTSWPFWQQISTTQTAPDGTYQFTNIGQGLGIDYRVQFVDPAYQLAPQYYNNSLTIDAAMPITLTLGVPRTDINAMLALSQPPSASVDTESGGVLYGPDGAARITIPVSDPSDITVTHAAICTAGTPLSVTLSLSSGSEYFMANIGGDLYRVAVPAMDLTGDVTLNVIVLCGDATTAVTVGYVTLYDPSGLITNALTGQPVGDATVTLYQVPDWLPKSGPDDLRPNTCESNLSKTSDVPWSQPAPIHLGVIVNPVVTVMSPGISSQKTTAAGYYGWDVPKGCWYITVEATGYESLVSPVVGIPPAVTDLDLALTPKNGFTVFLPLVLR